MAGIKLLEECVQATTKIGWRGMCEVADEELSTELALQDLRRSIEHHCR